ncbi:MAG: hypothetical protein OIN83_04915 [Candidatus Methanoperedens sp.]|nr:hypothetical protein [Candidatus Methanoperedens sp.]
MALVPYIWNTVRLLKPAPLFDRLTEEITNKSILDTIHNEQIKTDKESTLQPILDIVNGSIMKYDYGTAKYGLRAIGNKANDILKNRDIDKKEKKEISEHIFSHIVSAGQLAISKDNERSTSEIIAILCSNGITSVEQELEEVAFKTIISIRLLGVNALNNKLEFLATDACSSLRKVGEKSVEKDLKILTKQGGWWEIRSIKDIGMISAKYKLEYSIMVVANSIDLIGIAAVKHRLKGTIQMTIDSLEEVGMEAAKYKFIGGIRNVSASLGIMKDEMFGKEEFKNEEQKAINSHINILNILKKLEQNIEQE